MVEFAFCSQTRVGHIIGPKEGTSEGMVCDQGTERN